MRAGIGIAAGCIAVILATGCSTADPATELRVFNPWDVGTLRDGLQVVATEPGDCFSRASSVDRPDGWRCSAGSSLHDPCFVGGDAGRAACVDAPWSGTVSVVEMSETPPQQADVGDTGALWALELDGGERCLAIGGATATAAGQRLNYSCDGGGDVYGTADRRTERWTVAYQANGALEQTRREVAVAWR